MRNSIPIRLAALGFVAGTLLLAWSGFARVDLGAPLVGAIIGLIVGAILPQRGWARLLVLVIALPIVSFLCTEGYEHLVYPPCDGWCYERLQSLVAFFASFACMPFAILAVFTGPRKEKSAWTV